MSPATPHKTRGPSATSLQEKARAHARRAPQIIEARGLTVEEVDQRAVLYVRDYWEEHGQGPTWRQLARIFGIRRHKGIEALLWFLIVRGVLSGSTAPNSLRVKDHPPEQPPPVSS